MADKKPGFGRAALAAALCFGFIAVLASVDRDSSTVATTKTEERYSLIHSIGNSEKTNTTGLSKAECQKQKAELKAVATALGSYNEASGYGSIVCLPENQD